MSSTNTHPLECTASMTYLRHPKNSYFNTKHYINVHLPLTEKYWGPLGLKGWTVVQYPETDPSGDYHPVRDILHLPLAGMSWCYGGIFIQALLRWESREKAEHAFTTMWDPEFKELVDDVKLYYPDMPDGALVKYVGTTLAVSG